MILVGPVFSVSWRAMGPEFGPLKLRSFPVVSVKQLGARADSVWGS